MRADVAAAHLIAHSTRTSQQQVRHHDKTHHTKTSPQTYSLSQALVITRDVPTLFLLKKEDLVWCPRAERPVCSKTAFTAEIQLTQFAERVCSAILYALLTQTFCPGLGLRRYRWLIVFSVLALAALFSFSHSHTVLKRDLVVHAVAQAFRGHGNKQLTLDADTLSRINSALEDALCRYRGAFDIGERQTPREIFTVSAHLALTNPP